MENAIEVRITKEPLRVEAIPHREEVGEAGVALPQRLRAERVHLPPVRSPLEAQHDLLDGLEVLRGILPPVPVDGDVARRATVGGRQPAVIGRCEPHLDREADTPPAVVDERAQGLERGAEVLGGITAPAAHAIS